MLAASPLFAGSHFFGSPLTNLLTTNLVTGGKTASVLDIIEQSDPVIASPDEALNVMDFEPTARKALPPAHFGYFATGVDDDGTVRANREGYSHIQIRPRRLVDVEKVDMSVRLFGNTWSSPIVISPLSSQKAFQPEGDIAVARAARAKGHLQIVATLATSSIEEVMAARDAPVWQQAPRRRRNQGQESYGLQPRLNYARTFKPKTKACPGSNPGAFYIYRAYP